MRVVIQQRLGGDEEPRRAVAALRGAEIRKRLLERMEPVGSGHSLDGLDAFAFALETENEAREHWPAVDIGPGTQSDERS